MIKEIQIPRTPKQAEMEQRMIGRIITIPKGRRFGLTNWYFGKIIELFCSGISPILWGDTIYPNIKRYIERSFMPLLNQFDNNQWQWNKTSNEIRFNINGLKFNNKDCILDFRSGDNPENWEGFGYKYVFINEAGIVMKDKKLWQNSIRPMMLDYGAFAIIGGTPKGKKIRDGSIHPFYELVLKAHEEENEIALGKRDPKDRYYQTMNYSTYDNDWLDKHEIEEYVSSIPPAIRDQEVYGKFIDINVDPIFKYWNYYSSTATPEFQYVVQSWDLALGHKETNDFNACTTWGITFNKQIYLIDVYNKRVEFPQLIRDAEMMYRKFDVDYLLIENKASGKPLDDSLREKASIGSILIEPKGDKVSRAHAVSPMFEQNQILIPSDKEWRESYLYQMENFPGEVEFDDMVDSTTQALEFIKTKMKKNNLSDKKVYVHQTETQKQLGGFGNAGH